MTRGHGRERPGLPAQRPPHAAHCPRPAAPAALTWARRSHRTVLTILPLYTAPLYCPLCMSPRALSIPVTPL